MPPSRKVIARATVIEEMLPLVSFGLPVRSPINRGFLMLMQEAGFDMAIRDRRDRELRRAPLAAEVVLQLGLHCLGYTRAFRAGLLEQACSRRLSALTVGRGSTSSQRLGASQDVRGRPSPPWPPGPGAAMSQGQGPEAPTTNQGVSCGRPDRGRLAKVVWPGVAFTPAGTL